MAVANPEHPARCVGLIDRAGVQRTALSPPSVLPSACRLLISSSRKPISYVPAAKVSAGWRRQAVRLPAQVPTDMWAQPCLRGIIHAVHAPDCAASCLPPVQRLLQEHGEVHLSALGIACSSMVTVAEILKSRK